MKQNKTFAPWLFGNNDHFRANVVPQVPNHHYILIHIEMSDIDMEANQNRDVNVI